MLAGLKFEIDSGPLLSYYLKLLF